MNLPLTMTVTTGTMIIAMTLMTGTIKLVMLADKSPERLIFGKPVGSKRQKKTLKANWKRLCKFPQGQNTKVPWRRKYEKRIELYYCFLVKKIDR